MKFANLSFGSLCTWGQSALILYVAASFSLTEMCFSSDNLQRI